MVCVRCNGIIKEAGRLFFLCISRPNRDDRNVHFRSCIRDLIYSTWAEASNLIGLASRRLVEPMQDIIYLLSITNRPGALATHHCSSDVIGLHTVEESEFLRWYNLGILIYLALVSNRTTPSD